MERKHIFLIIIILIVIFHIILFIPKIPAEESYEEIELYNRSATYEIVSSELIREWNLTGDKYYTSEIILKNTDSFDGEFSVDHDLKFALNPETMSVGTRLDAPPNGVFLRPIWDLGITHFIHKQTTKAFVESGQNHTFTARLDGRFTARLDGRYGHGNYDFSVSAPTIRDYRVVTKQRTVYKSLMELLLGR